MDTCLTQIEMMEVVEAFSTMSAIDSFLGVFLGLAAVELIKLICSCCDLKSKAQVNESSDTERVE